MFQAHSFLWHYLWVAPNILLLVLTVLMLKRGLNRRVPAFFTFVVLSAVCELTSYSADIIPSVDPWTFWRIDWVGILVVGLLKFLVIAEIFAQVFRGYASIAKLSKALIRSVGVVLVLMAAILASYAPPNSRFGIIQGAHLLEHAIYLIESGLLLFIFVFSYYFRLLWNRPLLGIALGLSVSSCVHLAVLALTNSGLPNEKRVIPVLLGMATYHVCVLIWIYFLLVPKKKSGPKPPVFLPDHDSEVWNQELERLLHQ